MMKLFNKITRRELIFLCAWAIFTCTIIVGVTFLKFQDGYEPIGMTTKLLRFLSYGMCVVIILQRTYKRSMMIGIILASGIILMSTLMSSNTIMIWCILFIVAAIGIEAEKICFISVVTRGIMIFGTILLTKVGIINDYIFSASTRARHGLGFDWATTGPILFFFLTLVYIYLRRENLEIIELLIIEIGHYIFFDYTDSRMAFYLGTLSVFIFSVSVIVKKKWYITKRIGYLVCFAPVVIGVLAILIHVLYDENNLIWLKLNNLLSGRLELGYNAFYTYGITLFGKKIEWVGFGIDESGIGYNYVDCSYLQHMLEFGIVFILFVIAIYTILIYRGVKHNDYYLVWICLITLLFCVTEPWLFNFTFNPIPIMVFAKMKDRTSERDGMLNDEKECKNCYSHT